MLAALVWTVGDFAIPAKFLLADFRVVVGADDQGFKQFETLLTLIRCQFAGLASCRPVAGRSRKSPWHEQRGLFVSAELAEIILELLLAFCVDERQRIAEFFLELRRLRGKQKVDESIDQRVFGAGTTSRGDDNFAQRDDGFILMFIEKDRLPVGVAEDLRAILAARGRSETRIDCLRKRE